MAEAKTNYIKRTMWLDALPEEHPEQYVSYALNATTTNLASDKNNYQNTFGTTEDVLAPYSPIGGITLPDNRRVIFSTDNSNSEIGIVTNGKYETIINYTPLNFSKNHLIKGNYRLVNGCEYILYYYDNYNPDRILALDDLNIHKDDLGQWDVDLMRLQALFTIPELSDFDVNQGGGSLEVGKYHFAIEALDRNLNSLGYSRITKGVNIYQDSLYEDITGDVNIEAFPNEGIPKVSKSISFSVSNLDGYYARIYVIQKTAGDGATVSVFSKSQLIRLTSDNFSYTFRGITETDVQETLDKIVVGNAFYERSSAQEIVDNRMVRAGVTEQAIDYTGFQRHANTFVVSPVVTQVDPFTLTDGKSPTNYQSGIGDEVVSLGVVYKFRQGFNSPAFHIPGREAFPSELLDVTITEAEEHLGPIGSTVPSWKINNNGDENQLGYYESSSTNYPETLDCNGEYVWGNLAGQAIRHHKLPSRRVIPLMKVVNFNLKVNLLGLDIVQTEDYPHPDIVDHFYVIGIPTSTDKQVEDIGMSLYRVGSLGQIVPNYAYGTQGGAIFTHDKWWFNSIRSLTGNYVNGDYVRFTNAFQPYLDSDSDFVNGNDNQNGTDVQGSLIIYGSPLPGAGSIIWDAKLNASAFVQRKTTYLSGLDATEKTVVEFDNAKVNYPNERKEGFFLWTNRTYQFPVGTTPNRAIYTLVMNNRDVYVDLFNIRYQEFTGTEFGSYVAPITVTTSRSDLNANGTDLEEIHCTAQTFYLESRINPGLRLPNYLHIQDINVPSKSRFNNHFISAYYDGADPRAQATLENWSFNPDYSDDDLRQYHYPIPLSYRYCSKCLGEFPNRIVYSQVSFGEELQDGFRVYQNDDYIHIGDSPITNLRYDRGRLAIHTETSLYFLNPNPRTIQSDTDNIFLGTGDFLSIPPVQLSRTVHGHAGCQGRHHLVGTEEGWFFVDQRQSSVFLLQGTQPVDLSSAQFGLSRWFSENLPSRLLRQIPEYAHKDTPYGIGLIATYDPEFSRYMLTKKDYEVLNYGGIVKADTLYEPGKVYYRIVDSAFLTVSGNDVVAVEIGNPRYFANKSWTISFSLDDKGWDSFHSFLPNFYQQDQDTFYSAVDQQIWKHNAGSIGSIYGNLKDFIVEVTVTNPTEAYLERVLWFAKTYQGEKLLDFPTFNKIIAYTERQSTGMINLVPRENYKKRWSSDTKEVNLFKGFYTLSGLRDLAIDNPVFSSDWQDIQGQFPIDKVPVNIDQTINQYRQDPIRGKAIRLRFIYTGENKIIFNVSMTQIRNALR